MITAVDYFQTLRPAHINPFDADEVAHHVSKLMGRRHFEDSLGICNFTSRAKLAYVCEALNAATGWDYDLNEAQRFGRRVAALLRAFNVRCGIGPEVERPSKRYGSQPVDGPAAEHDIKPHFERMKGIYYDNLGYDRATGKPAAELLKQMGLEHVAKALWS